MLDQETKRRINNARDVLVGKVPDPKAQVEQITTALIYKFMDDMDREAEELGGKPSFFTDGFTQYSWGKLMDKKLSGQERLNLYVEAITKMSQNPHIPQLFRNIFKDAFLPYRAPETLHLFLKEINDFTYDHSENLGNAFEYLLSIMGSQGDAGQFRTPRHIIDFIVDVINPQKDETILDPACGTAGFLISAYKHIIADHDCKDNITGKPTNKEKPLTPDEKKKMMNNFVGYDISPDMVRLSLVNMYLHGFSEPKISEYDTLSSEDKWDESFDVIMANPPFMTPKGGIRPHKRFSVQANRSEVLFVDYILEHLNQNGRAGIIVPEGIIFQSANAYKKLRQFLVEDGLFAVVSLPAGVFNPYAGVKTSILFFDNQIAKLAKNILFVKITDDGFDLGAQRRKIEKNDLPKALEILKLWRKNVGAENFQPDNKIANMVSKEKIAESGDYNLTGERYREVEVYKNQKWETVELGEVCEFFGKGKRSASFKNEKGDIPFIVSSVNEKKCEIADFNFEALIIGDGGSANIHYKNIPFSSSDHTYILKNKNNSNIKLKFIYNFLKNRLDLVEAGFKGGGLKNVSKSHLQKIKIPLPPLEIQKEIVAELDGYQKIIDGAKQVVRNYKPTIKIDPEWEIVKLEEVCRTISGGTPSKQNEKFWKNGNIKWISAKHIDKESRISGFEFITKEAVKKSSTKIIPKNEIILVTRVSVGKIAVADDEYAINQDLTGIISDKEKLDTKYLFLALINGIDEIENKAQGLGVKGITRKDLQQIQIPFPPLKIQKQIVAEIEAEQKIVDQNKKLIEIIEQKIADILSEI